MFSASASTCPGSRPMSLLAARIVAANNMADFRSSVTSRPTRRPVPRLPTCPDLVPIIATGIRVGVRVTRRNRQHLNGWNTRVWGLGNSVDKKIVEFGHFITVGALYFDLAARIVVVASGRELATSLMILNQRAEPNTGFPSRARRRQTTPRFDHPKPCSCLYGERVALLHLVRGEHP